MEALLGEQLRSKDLLVPTSDLQTFEFVLLFFSANWSPPDKLFISSLIEFYADTKDRLQVVFVSSDESAEAFEQYYATMPWVAVPYDQEAIREALAIKYNVQGIPTTVLVRTEDWELLSSDLTEQMTAVGAAALTTFG